MEIIKHSGQAKQGRGERERGAKSQVKLIKNARADRRMLVSLARERERKREGGGNSLSCFKNSHTKGNDAWQYFCFLIYVAALQGRGREGGGQSECELKLHC